MKVVAIVGPTATGKTDLAIFLCQKFNGESISVDSRQAYREMEIGTGKKTISDPSKENDVQTHLHDLVPPSERLNAHDYSRLVWKKMEEIWSTNKIPFLVGGTGFYMDVILGRRFLSGVGADPFLRQELESLSTTSLAKRLGRLSTAKLQIIDTRNRYRLVRAIEILEKTKVTKEDLPAQFKKITLALIFGLTASNAFLYGRSDERIDEMFKRGLEAEVLSLSEKYGWEAPGLKTLGYREFKPYFEGRVSLHEAKQRLKFNTHAYIRRQKTYFKKYFADAFWVDVGKEGFEELVANKVESFLR